MEKIYLIFDVTATMAETVILLDFINRFLKSKLEGIKNVFQFVASFLLISTIMITFSYAFEEYSAVSDIIGIICYIAYTLIFMKSSVIYKILTPVLSIMSIFVISMIINIMAQNFLDYSPAELLSNQDISRIILLIITKIVFFLLTRIILKIFKPKDVLLNMRELLAISLIFIISGTILCFSAEVYYNITDNRNIVNTFIVILSIGIILINAITFILLNMIAKKNRSEIEYSVIMAQFEEQKKSHESIKKVYSNLQILKHDLKNEMLLLQRMIEEDKNDEAIDYITKFTNTKLNTFYEYVNTGNSIIDAIINIKLNLARDVGIDVMISINTDFSDYDTDDVLCIFSNAVDNAIESASLQENGRIKINIEYKRSYLFMTIGNTIPSSVLSKNSLLKTTKKDKTMHGFGTQSMKHIAEKYDGLIEYYEKDSMFVTNIMLKNISKSADIL